MTTLQQEHLGVTGAKRSRYYSDSPDGLLRKLVEKMPAATETELEEAFEEQALNQGGPLLSSIISYWFANRYRALQREREPVIERRRRQAATEQRMAIKVAAVKQATVGAIARTLLDRVAPGCGKVVGDMTKDDCAREGGWYTRLAELVPTGQTVSRAGLTDADLWQLYTS